MNKTSCIDKTHNFFVKKGEGGRILNCYCNKYWIKANINSTWDGEVGVDMCKYLPNKMRSLLITDEKMLRMNY